MKKHILRLSCSKAVVVTCLALIYINLIKNKFQSENILTAKKKKYLFHCFSKVRKATNLCNHYIQARSQGRAGKGARGEGRTLPPARPK